MYTFTPWVDTDQTAPLDQFDMQKAVWYGSTLFLQDYMLEHLG